MLILLLPGNELSCAPRALARKQLSAMPLPTDLVLTLLIAVYHTITFVCVYRIRNIFLFLNLLCSNLYAVVCVPGELRLPWCGGCA